MADHNDWREQADKQLWSLVTRELRAAERHIQALADVARVPDNPAKRRLDRARAFATLAYARELARFCYSAEQRRLAQRMINRTAKALRETVPEAAGPK